MTARTKVILFEVEKAARYLNGVFVGYLNDPADSDFQKGFLAAALAIYREGLGKGVGDDRLKLLDAQLTKHDPNTPCLEGDG